MQLKTTIVRNIKELSLGRKEWNLLVDKNETNTIFQTYDWILSWWSVFGEKHSLFLLIFHDQNDDLIGIAPLCIKTHNIRRRELVFIGDGNADYQDFLISREKEIVVHKILNVIKQYNNIWNSFVLRNIPECSTTFSLLMSLSSTLHLNIILAQETLCPSLVVNDNGIEAKKIINKYSVKRPLNYFSKLGNLQHNIFRDSNEAEYHIDKFFNQHIERWKNTPNPSLFLDESNRLFYHKLLATLLPRHEVLFSAVTLDDKPISYHFGFDYNSVVTWYKPAFSPDYAKRSPGSLLVRFLIEYVLENNRKELDFTIGDEAFKDRFTNVQRHNATIIIFSNKYYYLYFESIRRVKTLFKIFIKRH